METTAKYRLIGAFTLAAIVAVFAFVYWLNNGGALGERSISQIRFLGPVPGLRPGAAVQFNGIRVGEVISLTLDQKRPQEVLAEISVDRATPVRADTQVMLDFQGLMGVTSVALKGGTAQAPALSNARPLLTADASAGLDLSTTARDALRRLDGILADNTTTLKDTFSNLSAFTGALARNSDRIDGIVSGLERMTGGSKAPALSFDLTAPAVAVDAAYDGGPLSIAEPAALFVYDTQRLIVRTASGARTPMEGNAQWAENLPKLVHMRLVQAMEGATSPKAVIRPSDNLPSDRQMLVDIRSFDFMTGELPTATVELGARIIGDSRVMEARSFSASVQATSVEPGAAAAALNEAFGQVARDLVLWARAAH
jgi:phospholipid/cholesterol/gamma-HCH transport system substrate-binding protein